MKLTKKLKTHIDGTKSSLEKSSGSVKGAIYMMYDSGCGKMFCGFGVLIEIG